MSFLICLAVPLTAIILSFLTKRVHLSLGVGIALGFVMLYFDPGHSSYETFKNVLNDVLLKGDNIKITLFTTLISLTVSLMIYNGSISQIANRLGRFAYDRKSAQLMTWFTGLAIFFDDYANTLIVGNTLRPITDKYKVSREKLAYIVDSTAAPVAAIAFVSTWIGYEVTTIGTALGDNLVGSPYSYFLHSLNYSYYPIFTLAFILITILTGREYGPMLTAPVVEVKAEKEEANEKKSLFKSLLPILILLFFSLGTMAYTGYKNIGHTAEWSLRDLIAASDSINSLLIGSILSFVSAHFCSTCKLFDEPYFYSLLDGAKKIAEPLLILVLAWVLGHLIGVLDTAECILAIMPKDTTPYILPAIIFLISGLISFATGSSFSTMGIVYPVALPIVINLCASAGVSVEMSQEILYHAISCVLAGAVFGDHCSPISDTTVLSSLACECDHIQHVRTQLPYALTVGAVSVFFSFTVANMNLPTVFVYGVGILVIYMIIKVFGRTKK